MNFAPSKKETEHVRESLYAFNKAIVGDDGHTPLSIVEYDNDGNVIGGILGGTYWGWMYIDILWVDEKHRKQGIGTRLLHEAESEAACRGCHHVHLDTMSWQAPEFYKKHGYEVIGILPDILNTLYIVLATLVLVLPLGVGAAVYLTEYAQNKRLVGMIEYAAETLSGIPSIIYGLVGMLLFSNNFGTSLLAGALTLVIMNLPTVMRTTQESLKTVPQSYREGAFGLGAGKYPC